MSKKGVLKKALGLLSHYLELSGKVSVSIPIDKKKFYHYRKITNQLRDIIEKDGLKINNSNDDNHIAVINSISVYEKNDKTEIPLDNSNYNSHFD